MDAPDQSGSDLDLDLDADPSVDDSDDDEYLAFATMEELLVEALEGVRPEPGTTKSDLEEMSLEVLGDFESELLPGYQAMVEHQLVEPDVPWYVDFLWSIGGLIALVALVALSGLGALGVAKLFGQLQDWSFVPWALVVVVGWGAAIVIVFAAERWETQQSAGQQVVFERMERRFEQQLSSLVVQEAKNRLRRADWSDPATDAVTIRTSPGLSAQIDRSGRVRTESYEKVRSHLLREGGAAVGLSGPRGAGKIELLEEFCVIPHRASTDNGGTIGVLLSTPTALAPAATISLLIRKLCERIPGYGDPWIGPTVRSWTPVVGWVLWVLAIAAIAVGWYMTDPSLFGAADMERRTFGRVLMAVGVGLVFGMAMIGIARRNEISTARLDPRLWLRKKTRGAGTKAARLDRMDAVVYAKQVARRTRYTETRTTSGEASGGVAKLSAKFRHELKLQQISLSEADLVDEFANLVKRLRDAGYEVVIGIDELDKLKADEEAEDFLNGLKALFTVRDCSFLVSVSESAWGKFVQRGILLRDTFDSSLDAVVILVPPTLSQARAFLKLREPDLTDSQILFCYCLSGGIPRDLIRAARRLGETNQAMRGDMNWLRDVGRQVLHEEARDTISAALLNARALPAGAATAKYNFRLELLREHRYRGQQASQLLIEADPEFKALLDRDPTATCEPPLDVQPDESQNADSTDESRHMVREQQRRTLTYLWFLHAMERAFARPGLVAGLPERLDPPRENLICFLELAKARRRLETSPASAWMVIDKVSDRFGLALEESPDEDDVTVHLEDEAPVPSI